MLLVITIYKKGVPEEVAPFFVYTGSMELL